MKRLKLIILMVMMLSFMFTMTDAGRAAIRSAAKPLADVFSISWWTVDNGGGVSQGGLYRISGTAGQPDAGKSTGGTYDLSGGFWSGSLNYMTRLPMVSRGGSP